MKITRNPAEMQARMLASKRAGQRIGFVPTMGFLHEGHLSLVRKARELSDICIVSIFVNPTQFGANEDLDRYPRDEAHDCDLCERAGVDFVFCPQACDMYPAGYTITICEQELASGLCGASRPGHFDGVLTVVAKLFNIVQPDVAVFGQKDYQQARVIEQLVADLNMPVEIVVQPIIREDDGLAMSSRNTYLSKAGRIRARCLHESLALAESLIEDGERDAGVVVERIREKILGSSPVEAGLEIDYVAVVDGTTLKPVVEIGGRCCIALAVRVDGVRLIDNTLVTL